MKKQRMIICSLILFVLICINNSASAQSGEDIVQKFERRFFTYQNTTLPYRLFIPENYDPAQSYPLVLCLHCVAAVPMSGAGEMVEAIQLSGMDVFTVRNGG